MSENNVRICDEYHVYINGRQFVSLNRLAEIKRDHGKEMKLLQEENARLDKENKALRVLLRQELEKENQGE